MSAAAVFVLAVVIAGLVMLILVMNQETARDHQPRHESRQQDVAACIGHLAPEDRTVPVVAHCHSDPLDAVARGVP